MPRCDMIICGGWGIPARSNFGARLARGADSRTPPITLPLATRSSKPFESAPSVWLHAPRCTPRRRTGELAMPAEGRTFRLLKGGGMVPAGDSPTEDRRVKRDSAMLLPAENDSTIE